MACRLLLLITNYYKIQKKYSTFNNNKNDSNFLYA